jgi:hypothetical protein
MVQYSQYGPIFVCVYEVTGQKSQFCDKKGLVGLVAH